MEEAQLNTVALKYPDRIVVHTSQGNLVVHNNDRRPPLWNRHGPTHLTRLELGEYRVFAGHGFIRLAQPVPA